jgi:hypothetical protein
MAALKPAHTHTHTHTHTHMHTHTHTHTHSLYERIDHAHLREEGGGAYLPYAADLALMFPVMEMAGHRVEWVSDMVLVYTCTHIHTHTHTHARTHTHTRTHARTRTNALTHTHRCVRSHTCTT